MEQSNTTNPSASEEDEEVEMAVAAKQSTAVVHQPHPLECSWTFWFNSPGAKASSKQVNWDRSLRPIYTLATAEEFWRAKMGDPDCANGGKWTISFPRRKSDMSWLYTLLALIGEQFDRGDEICGAVVNVRSRAEKISLWAKNASDEAAQMSIGKQWKEILDYNHTIGFMFHEDAKKLGRAAKNRYTI